MASTTHHIVIFPFMAQGHTLPLLDLSKALSHRGIKVTIITTPSNAISISQYLLNNYPNIHLTQIPFTTINGLPKGCENTSQLPSVSFYLPFLIATKKLRKPFEQVLKTMSQSNTLPICLISDFFLGWTLGVCQAYKVPRLVFHGMGVLSMAISKTIWVNTPHFTSNAVSDTLHLPGLKLPFILTSGDLSDTFDYTLDHHDDPLSQFISEMGEADVNSWGVIVNSYVELEKCYLSSFESFYKNGVKAWCLGPLFLYNQSMKKISEKVVDKKSCDEQLHSLIDKWLTEQATSGSVIYVSFGTQADVSDAQLDEVAFGLEESGFSFVWVVRSTTWSPPAGMEDRVNGKGLIIREWVDQRRILAHHGTGGFLSHCGWNSVLESISAGVPILAWPMIGEQSLNAKLVVEGLGAGISVKRELSMEPKKRVSRHTIGDGVRELMGGEKGKNARQKAEALGRAARRAVQEGGSSYDTLSNLITQLCACCP